MGSVKVCEFCGLLSAREKLSAYQSENAFPKTVQKLNKKIKKFHVKSQRTNFLSLLTDRVRRTPATAKVVALYRMCGRVAHLHAALLRLGAGTMPGFCVCEQFVNFEGILLYEPCAFTPGCTRMDASRTRLSCRVGLRAAGIPLYTICCLEHRAVVLESSKQTACLE